MNVRLTKPEEQLRTQELFALAFGIPMERGEEPEPDEALHWAAFDEDGEMMSTLTVPEFTVQFDGQPCRMGGIGGVATLPQYRRRGGIRGCFAVTFAGGKALCVENSAEEPDVTLTIPAFSSLIAGTCDFSEAARWMDGLTVHDPAAPLERIFYRKPLFIDDYF